jgi:hypothetical protein
MEDNKKDDWEDIPLLSESQSQEDDWEDLPLDGNSDNLLEQLPTEVRPIFGGTTGYAAGKGSQKILELLGAGLEDTGSTIVEGSRQVPFVGDVTGSAKYAAEGKSVVGKGLFGDASKTRETILDESLDVAKDWKNVVDKQKKESSKKIGSLINLTDKKIGPKNYNETLNKIQKGLLEIEAPTEESKKSVTELQNLLESKKITESDYNIVSKKQVKSGLEEAKERLKTIQNKIKMEAEELGQIKSFGPIKEKKAANRVSSLDIDSGKVISTPIKTGEFTPIDIEKLDKKYFDNLDTQGLKNLQKNIRAVKDQSPIAVQRTPIYNKIIQAEQDIKSIISDRIKQGLGEAKSEMYDNANKSYRSTIDMEDLIPNITKDSKSKEIDVSNFLRSLEDDSKSSDVKNQKFKAFIEESTQDPEKLKILEKKTRELADRYNLSDLTRKIGIDSTSLRNLGVRAGDVLGKSYNAARTLAKGFVKALPLIGAGAGIMITYDQAIAAGATEEEAMEIAVDQTASDEVLGFLSAERTGPMETIAKKQESGDPLTEEEYKILRDRALKQNKKMMEDPNTNFNKAADEIEKLDNGRFKPVANQVRSLDNKKDKRLLKANSHILQNSQGYKELEKFLEKKLKNVSSEFMSVDPMLQQEDGIDLKKEQNDIERSPQGITEQSSLKIKSLNNEQIAKIQNIIGANVDGIYGDETEKKLNEYTQTNNESVDDILNKDVNFDINRKGTKINKNLEGTVKSANYSPTFRLGNIDARLTAADKEKGLGHGSKDIDYIDTQTGEITNHKGKFNLGYDYVPSKDLDSDKEGIQYNPMFGGNVVLSGVDQNSKGHGNSIVIKNPDTIKIGDKEYYTYAAYGHNSNNIIKEGEPVDGSDTIATMGGTTFKDGKIEQNKYPDHVDIRTFLIEKEKKDDILDKNIDTEKQILNNRKKLYVNPKELEYFLRKK